MSVIKLLNSALFYRIVRWNNFFPIGEDGEKRVQSCEENTNRGWKAAECAGQEGWRFPIRSSTATYPRGQPVSCQNRATCQQVKTMSAAAKPAKAKKAAKPAAHPPYASMITAAIKGLKDKKGSSRQAILKYIVANNKVDAAKAGVRVKLALRKMVAAKKVVAAAAAGKKGAGSFKLPAKEPKAKKPKAKKAKKPAAKKPKAAKKPAAKKAKKPAAKKAAKPKAAKKPAAKKAAKKPAKKAAPKKK